MQQRALVPLATHVTNGNTIPLIVVADRDAPTALLSQASVSKLPRPSSSLYPCGFSVCVVAGATYCIASMAMVLINKMALSSFDFNCTTALLCFQCTTCLVMVKLCEKLRLVHIQPFNLAVARVWLPITLFFVGMVGTSFLALRNLNVAMVTVLKNLTNFFTISGDFCLYGRRYNTGVWACIVMMLVSALCGAATDLSFNAAGYFWQIVNCGFTACYSLSLRGAVDRVAEVTTDGKRLSELSMVYYNNIMSLPFLLVLMACNGEMLGLLSEPALRNPAFLRVAASSGLMGFIISFTTLWFITTTTPTIYSLVGSLNKVPLAFLGLLLFQAPWSLQNLASITVGLGAGVVFAIAKTK